MSKILLLLAPDLFLKRVREEKHEKINNSVFGANQTSEMIFKLNLNKVKTALIFNFNSPLFPATLSSPPRTFS